MLVLVLAEHHRGVDGVRRRVRTSVPRQGEQRGADVARGEGGGVALCVEGCGAGGPEGGGRDGGVGAGGVEEDGRDGRGERGEERLGLADGLGGDEKGDGDELDSEGVELPLPGLISPAALWTA